MKVLKGWDAKWTIKNGTFWNIPEGSRLSDSLPLPKCTVPTQNFRCRLLTIVTIMTIVTIVTMSYLLALLLSLPVPTPKKYTSN